MPEKPPSIMRALGLVTGDLWHTITGKPRKPAPKKRVLRQETTEEVRQTEQGNVVLRRTVIEEVEVRRTPPPPGAE
jgi:hypothetical protein